MKYSCVIFDQNPNFFIVLRLFPYFFHPRALLAEIYTLGNIFFSTSMTVARVKITKAVLGDDEPHPHYLAHIPRKHRFKKPVSFTMIKKNQVIRVHGPAVTCSCKPMEVQLCFLYFFYALWCFFDSWRQLGIFKYKTFIVLWGHSNNT